MKWQNKGHEFEKEIACWRKVEAIYIYGYGNCGLQLINLLKFVDLYNQIPVSFVDSNLRKQETKDFRVISLTWFIEEVKNKEHYVVIDSTAGCQASLFLKNEFLSGIKLLSAEEFINKFIPAFLWDTRGKFFCPSAAVHFGTACNLKCNGCGVLTDRYTTKYSRNVEDVLADTRAVLERFDYIYRFGTSGGEPFLYKDLYMIFEEAAKYGEKIYSIGSTTNCTIEMPGNLIAACRMFNTKSKYRGIGGGVIIHADDYSENVAESNADAIIETCRKNEINAVKVYYDKWVDFGMGVSNFDMSEESVIKYHDFCNNSCWWVYDSRFYTCSFVISAVNAGLVENRSNNFIELNKCGELEFIEFINGYCEDGYFDLCRKCGGYITINKNFIDAAVQR